MGVDSDLLEIEDSVLNNHFLGVQVRNGCSNFRF